MPVPGAQASQRKEFRHFAKIRAKKSIANGCRLVYNGAMAKTRMNINLNAEQKRKLGKLSDKTGAPVAELVRRAIDAYLSLRRKELK
jgi:Ribbon-helix-helix domain